MHLRFAYNLAYLRYSLDINLLIKSMEGKKNCKIMKAREILTFDCEIFTCFLKTAFDKIFDKNLLRWHPKVIKGVNLFMKLLYELLGRENEYSTKFEATRSNN